MNTTYLKLLDKIKSIEESMIKIDDIFPVGSYYESSDKAFDPNISWKGTTWVQDSVGYVTVGANINTDVIAIDENLVDLGVGDTFGEVKHKITQNELPNYTLSNGAVVWAGGHNGNIALANSQSTYSQNAWRGEQSITLGGKGELHNNVQPSIGVIRWHRIV